MSDFLSDLCDFASFNLSFTNCFCFRNMIIKLYSSLDNSSSCCCNNVGEGEGEESSIELEGGREVSEGVRDGRDEEDDEGRRDDEWKEDEGGKDEGGRKDEGIGDD